MHTIVFDLSSGRGPRFVTERAGGRGSSMYARPDVSLTVRFEHGDIFFPSFKKIMQTVWRMAYSYWTVQNRDLMYTITETI